MVFIIGSLQHFHIAQNFFTILARLGNIESFFLVFCRSCLSLAHLTQIFCLFFFSEIDFGKIHDQTPPKLKLYLPSNEPGQPGFYEEVDVS